MGWVNSDLAATGSKLTLRTNGQMAQATVVDMPFYDPEGKQVKS
jgi:glycine cleavage system aminomethyltransferase T